MSDTRLTLLGIVLIFAGFIILGAFGSQFIAADLEAKEFGSCYEYRDNAPAILIDCNALLQAKSAFFVLVIGLIGAGILMLVLGARGRWDQRSLPEGEAGPSR